MSWWTQLFKKTPRAKKFPSGANQNSTTTPPGKSLQQAEIAGNGDRSSPDAASHVEFSGADPEALSKHRQALLKGLESIAIQDPQAFRNWWRGRPVAETGTANETVDWLIRMIAQEARFINAHVANIQKLNVQCSFSQGEVPGLSVPLFRRFVDGGVDGIPHFVARTGEDLYVVGHVPIDG